MAMGKGKPDLTVVLGHLMPHKGEEGEQEDGDESPKIAAMKQFIDCVKEGDAKGACESLDAYHEHDEPDGDEGPPSQPGESKGDGY